MKEGDAPDALLAAALEELAGARRVLGLVLDIALDPALDLEGRAAAITRLRDDLRGQRPSRSQRRALTALARRPRKAHDGQARG